MWGSQTSILSQKKHLLGLDSLKVCMFKILSKQCHPAGWSINTHSESCLCQMYQRICSKLCSTKRVLIGFSSKVLKPFVDGPLVEYYEPVHHEYAINMLAFVVKMKPLVCDTSGVRLKGALSNQQFLGTCAWFEFQRLDLPPVKHPLSAFPSRDLPTEHFSHWVQNTK